MGKRLLPGFKPSAVGAASQQAIQSMHQWVSPILLLQKMQCESSSKALVVTYVYLMVINQQGPRKQFY